MDLSEKEDNIIEIPDSMNIHLNLRVIDWASA